MSDETKKTGALAVLVAALAAAREACVLAEKEIDEAEEAVKATAEGQNYFRAMETRRVTREFRDGVEADLRERAIALLDAGEPPHPAVTVKNFNVLDYDDGAALLEATLRGWTDCLKLDRKAFERRAVRALQGIDAVFKAMDDYASDVVDVDDALGFRDLVRRRVEPRPTIATDLSPWLPAETRDDPGAKTA